jgi:hypothetical protein
MDDAQLVELVSRLHDVRWPAERVVAAIGEARGGPAYVDLERLATDLGALRVTAREAGRLVARLRGPA